MKKILSLLCIFAATLFPFGLSSCSPIARVVYPDGRVGQISVMYLSCAPAERFVLIDDKVGQTPIIISACPPTARVVLIPEPDGSVGQVSVTTDAGLQMLNQPWEATELVSPDQLPGKPRVMDSNDVKNIFKEALDAQPAPSAVFRIYFASGSAALTSVSLLSLQKTIEAINSQKSNHILVLGYTDTVASVEYNRGLSLRRAEAVADMLVSQGVERAHIEIEYYGKEKLLVATKDGVNEPKNRSVEIIVR